MKGSMGRIFLFLVLISFVYQGCKPGYGRFQLSAPESVQAMLFANEAVAPEEIMEAVQKDSGSVFLVDIRTPAEFANGHLLHAVNIPAQHILEGPWLRLWKDKKTIYYLYGNTQLEANAPWMILRQMGYDNVRVLQGGLAYFSDFSDTSFLKLEDETARYDFAAVFSKSMAEVQKANAPLPKPELKSVPKTIVPKKRPKVEVVEEEEGC